MSDFKTDKYQLVELICNNISGNNQQIFFQQQPQLQGFNLPGQRVYIQAIETFSNSALTFSPITTNNPVATFDQIQNTVLTIVEGTKENRKQIPLAQINRVWPIAGSFVPFPAPLMVFTNLFAVSWTKSYVTCVQQPTSQPFSFLFGVHYSYNPSEGDIQIPFGLDVEY